MNPNYTQGAAYDPNGIVTRTDRQFATTATIASGQNLAAGTVLGQVTADGKFIESDSGAVDGSEAPRAVLLEACDATGGDKSALIALAGDFNASRLTFGGAHTAASARVNLAAVGVFLHDVVAG